MWDQQDSVGPLATLGLCICIVAALFGAFVGGIINGAITLTVVFASLSAIVALVAVVALLRRAGILIIGVQPPVWLERWERRSRADPRLSDGVSAAVAVAEDEARHFRHVQLGTEHLLLGLMRQRGHAARALESCGMTLETLIRAVDLIAGVGAEDLARAPSLAPSARRALLDASDVAREERSRVVTTAHLLLALAASPNQTAGAVLDHLGCTCPVLTDALRSVRRRGDD